MTTTKRRKHESDNENHSIEWRLVAARCGAKALTAETRANGSWHAYTILSVDPSARTVTIEAIGLYGTFIHDDGPAHAQPTAGRIITYTYDSFRHLFDDVYING